MASLISRMNSGYNLSRLHTPSGGQVPTILSLVEPPVGGRSKDKLGMEKGANAIQDHTVNRRQLKDHKRMDKIVDKVMGHNIPVFSTAAHPYRNIIEDRDDKLFSGDYVKLAMVRHPFTRLISAYKDLIAVKNDNQDNSFYAQLRRGIHTTYSDHSSLPPEGTSSFPTLLDFVEYITSEVNTSWPRPLQVEHNNIHWRSQADILGPCSIKYDYLLKVESMGADYKNLLEKMNTLNGDNMHKSLLPRVPLFNKSQGNTDLNELLNLRKDLISKLYEIYESDFKLFGY